ncbi:MAG: AAA family ATPase [Stappiaceae bacterium]
MAEAKTDKLIVLSGCSGGGKSTLLGELERRGFQVMPEAGRRVVRDAIETGKDVLPWHNPTGFSLSAARLAERDYQNALKSGEETIFDRAIIDLVAYLTMLSLPIPDALTNTFFECRYATTVFMTPPWLEIFCQDTERQKSFDEAIREYDHLLQFYGDQGYRPAIVPKTDVAQRADFIVNTLGL